MAAKRIAIFLVSFMFAYPSYSDPLTDAILLGAVDEVKVLIEGGIHVNKVDILHHTPVHYACGVGPLETVKLLVDAGANLRAQNDLCLMLAAMNRHYPIVQYLIKEGLDAHTKNSGNSSALHALATPPWYGKKISEKELSRYSTKSEKIARYLLNHGADVNDTDGKGSTPLDTLLRYRNWGSGWDIRGLAVLFKERGGKRSSDSSKKE